MGVRRDSKVPLCGIGGERDRGRRPRWIGDRAGMAVRDVVTLVNEVVPKFGRGTTVHRLLVEQSEGASPIHSAEVVSSGVTELNVFEKRLCVLRFFRVTATRPPETRTAPVIRSPGRTLRLMVTGAAGTNSYPAEYAAFPLRLQSPSVPICSSAGEESCEPPSPTQNAAAPTSPAEQICFG